MNKLIFALLVAVNIQAARADSISDYYSDSANTKAPAMSVAWDARRQIAYESLFMDEADISWIISNPAQYREHRKAGVCKIRAAGLAVRPTFTLMVHFLAKTGSPPLTHSTLIIFRQDDCK